MLASLAAAIVYCPVLACSGRLLSGSSGQLKALHFMAPATKLTAFEISE